MRPAQPAQKADLSPRADLRQAQHQRVISEIDRENPCAWLDRLSSHVWEHPAMDSSFSSSRSERVGDKILCIRMRRGNVLKRRVNPTHAAAGVEAIPECRE